MFKKQVYFFRNFFTHNLYFLLPLFLFLLLLARNPFSERNLIANFEPFPDTFHYVVPIHCLLEGQGWTICREGRSISQSVPGFYSIFLLPFILIENDPRVFYFLNISLSLFSFFLLVIIFRQLQISRWIQFIALGVYVTTFQVYWYPMLAMAENLLIPLVLSAVYLLIQKKLSRKQIVLAALITTGVYATKYAALGITATLALLFIWKIFTQEKEKKKQLTIIGMFIAISAVTFLLADNFQIFRALIPIVQSWIIPGSGQENAVVADSGWWLSPEFFTKNLSFYVRGILGESVPVLWKTDPLLPRFLLIATVFLSVFLSVFSLNNKKSRLLTLSLFSLIFIPVIPLSFFYAPNFRYVLYIIPLFILLGGVSIQSLINSAIPSQIKLIIFTVFLLFIGITFAQRLSPIKYQISLNLKHAETPWWYIAIKENDTYLAEISSGTQRPILITAIPPHLYDFYSFGEVQLLPLSYNHDFINNRTELWGEYDYSNLIELYKSFIEQGNEVYVTNYGLGNEIPRQNDFANIQQTFNLELVRTGCHNACNLWRVSIKPE